MNAKLAIASVAGVETIGGVAGAGYWYSQPKTLKDLLLSKNIKLLDVVGSDSDENWKTLANKHKGQEAININDTEIKRIEGLNITTTGTTVNFVYLKNKCKSLLDEKISNIKDPKVTEKNVTDWCTEQSPILKSQPASKNQLTSVPVPPPVGPGTGDRGVSDPGQGRS
ncbi:hypothetical protein A6V39_00315 [Candidatus Mycoplasma haematobovis]|uniref:Uncharacterized protein n=1 Tax=Candidatus Mycoplasma haematobovis TaxID=432608 RepID=A0A1A9QDF3_9MOLU|nr:hypothetical protein [Candidatus Mycoplasma haematobovis]OAL10493.1 hypothetical protein A6V39_00315 [Candidatus Mycoplasma haematobovis]